MIAPTRAERSRIVQDAINHAHHLVSDANGCEPQFALRRPPDGTVTVYFRPVHEKSDSAERAAFEDEARRKAEAARF